MRSVWLAFLFHLGFVLLNRKTGSKDRQRTHETLRLCMTNVDTLQ